MGIGIDNQGNKSSPLDEERYTRINRIENEDKLIDIKDDNTIKLGKHKDEINIIILIPKTKKTTADKDLTIKS